jgi:hypothetical protein
MLRNQIEQELTVQTLRKHRVELISFAEPLAKDDTGTSILLALKERRDERQASADRRVPVQIDPVAVDRFTRLMREQLVSGDVAARKAYLASIVDAVIVSENKIRIVGSNDNVRSTFGPKGQPTPVVRKSVQEWCPGAGSNHRHCDFQSHALPTELPGRRAGPRACERRVIVRQGGPVHPATPAASPGAASLHGPLADGPSDGKSRAFRLGQVQPASAPHIPSVILQPRPYRKTRHARPCAGHPRLGFL